MSDTLEGRVYRDGALEQSELAVVPSEIRRGGSERVEHDPLGSEERAFKRYLEGLLDTEISLWWCNAKDMAISGPVCYAPITWVHLAHALTKFGVSVVYRYVRPDKVHFAGYNAETGMLVGGEERENPRNPSTKRADMRITMSEAVECVDYALSRFVDVFLTSERARNGTPAHWDSEKGRFLGGYVAYMKKIFGNFVRNRIMREVFKDREILLAMSTNDDALFEEVAYERLTDEQLDRLDFMYERVPDGMRIIGEGAAHTNPRAKRILARFSRGQSELGTLFDAWCDEVHGARVASAGKLSAAITFDGEPHVRGALATV